MEFESVDFLSSDDESIFISDPQPTVNDDEITQQDTTLFSVSRADDIHLLTTSDYDNSDDKSVKELILSYDASPEHEWRKILHGPILITANEHSEQFLCPITFDWIESPIRLHKQYYSKSSLELLIAQIVNLLPV